MNKSVRAQIENYFSHIDALIRRGRHVRNSLATDPSNPSTILATRAWQEDCGVTVNQLSGGSKAHWLARSFSEAFLIRSANGGAVAGATPTEIVERLLEVLDQAVATLFGMDDGSRVPENSPESAGLESSPPHRFDFVHNLGLRPVIEQAYRDSRRALEQKDYELALRTTCGILEAIVTDALEHKGSIALAASGAPEGKIGNWPFEMRLDVAERAGLIRGGCARLPTIARTYRDYADSDVGNDAKTKVSERDARQAGQVLHVVMRDLDPGR